MLFVVIRLSADDGARPVYLFGEDEAHHLVGEGHPGQRNLLVGPVVDASGKAVRASDDEDEASGRVAFLFEPSGKLHAPELAAVLVHEYDGVGGLELSGYEFALHLLLLLLGEVFRVLQLRNGDDLERHVVAYALGIVADAGGKMLVGGLSYEYQYCFHFSCPSSFFLSAYSCLRFGFMGNQPFMTRFF